MKIINLITIIAIIIIMPTLTLADTWGSNLLTGNTRGDNVGAACGNQGGIRAGTLDLDSQDYGQRFTVAGSGQYHLNNISFKAAYSTAPSNGVDITIGIYTVSSSNPNTLLIQNSSTITLDAVYTSANSSSIYTYYFSNYNLTKGTEYYVVFSSTNVGESDQPYSLYITNAAGGGNWTQVARNDLDGSSATFDTNWNAGCDLPMTLGITYDASPPAATPTIILINQFPSNITNQNLQNTNVNISFNYTNESFSNQGLNFSVQRIGGSTCLTNINGTCLLNQGNLQNKTPTTITNYTGWQEVNYTLDEDETYPVIANLPDTSFKNIIHTSSDLTNDNRLIITNLTGIPTNTTLYAIWEVNANVSIGGSDLVYTCNSSGVGNNVITSSQCTEIGRINQTGFNHSENQSQFNIVPFIIINGRINNNITATSNMYLIIRGNNIGNSNTWTIPQSSRTGATYTSNNLGNTWTHQTYSLDQHLHLWTGTETINMTAQGKWTTQILNSSTSSELIDIAGTNPTIPFITNPLQTIQTSRYMNITWSQSFPSTPSSKIQNYTVQLLNNDTSLNATLTITNNATYNFFWDDFAQNLSTGEYYIRIIVNDSLGGTRQDFEEFNLTRNAELNITIRSAVNNTILTGAAINITPTGGSLEIWNTTTNQTIINIVKNTTYNLTVNQPGFAITSQEYDSNATTLQYLNLSIYTNNSVRINIYDESTGLVITQNITITFSGLTEFSNSTTTGSYYQDGLTDGTWTVKFQGTNYTLKQYTITVGSRSSQILNAFLSQSTSAVVMTALDFDSSASLVGATATQYRLINSTWTVIDTKTTDITGRVQFIYLANIKYQFIFSLTNYQTETFYLDPVLFSSYNVRLHKTTTLSPLNTPANLGIIVNFGPTQFFANQTTSFIWAINSPIGSLINYTLNISYPGGGQIFSGNNAIGEQFTHTVNITGATLTDKVYVKYCYASTTSSNQCLSYQYNIIGAYADTSFLANKDKTYGLGVLERTLIVSSIVLIVGGIAFMVGGILAGLPISLLLFGYFYYTGFIPLWSILPSLLVGIVMLLGRSSQ